MSEPTAGDAVVVTGPETYKELANPEPAKENRGEAMRQKTFEDIVNEAAAMRKGTEELEAALKELRDGSTWEPDLTSFLATVITGTAS